jgi:CHAT domain-containing protein
MGKDLVRYSLYKAILIASLFVAPNSRAQDAIGDTIRAEEYVKRAWDSYLQVEYDSSIFFYRRAADIFVKAERWERYVHCLNIIGDCYSREIRLDSMEVILQRARKVGGETLEPDNLECALTYSLLGLLYVGQDKLDVAIENILKGKKIRESKLGKDHRKVAASYFLLGAAYSYKGEYDKAIETCREALRIYTLLNDNDTFDLATTLMLIGTVFVRRSDNDIALSYFLKAQSLISDGNRKYAPLIVHCEHNLGWAYLEKGDYAKSIDHLTKAIDLHSRSFGENDVTMASCYSKLGAVYGALGDYDRAIEFYQKSLTMDKHLLGENHSFIAGIDKELAIALANKDEFDSALRSSYQSLSIYRNVYGENHPTLGYNYETLGNIYKKRGDDSLALVNYQRALAIRLQLRESYDRNDVANLYSEIGSVYKEMNHNEQAIGYFNRSLQLHNNLPEPNRSQRAATLKGLGDVYTKQREFATGLHYYQQAIITLVPEFSDTSIQSNPTPHDVTRGKDLVKVLGAKAVAFELCYSSRSRDISNLQASLASYECADRVVGRLRKRLTAEGSKLFLEEESHSLYQNAIRVSMKLFNATQRTRYKEAAFHFAENSRANILLDGLVDADAKQFGGIADSIIEMERSLRIDLTYYETKLQKEIDKKEKGDISKIIDLQNKCFALKNNIQELLTLLDKTYPRYYEMKYKIDSPTIGKLQHAIDDKTCLLEYSLDEHATYVFVITNTAFDAVAIPNSIGLQQIASTFHKSIIKIEREDFVRSSAALYDALLRPLEKRMSGKSRLIIIPDGLLHYLPFEALISDFPPQKNVAVDFSALNYVVRSHEISYAYSAGFYLNRLRQKSGKAKREKSFAGFAPVFRESDGNGVFLAKNASRLEIDSSEFRSISLDGKKFNELKFSGEEVSAIAEQFQKQGKPSASFLHGNATEENFKTRVGKYSYVHIATHGYINEGHPQLSMLLFSQPRDSTTKEDGVLYGGETYNLDLDVDLLVLSSCESGIGKLIKGEGIMAMTRGFFYSGATNIIFSLWKVYDRQTSDLMREFYRNVLAGETLSSSLRQAKLKMIADRTSAFPSKWSGFILVGN